MDKKIAILYFSNSGFSLRYAEMIANKVNGDLFDAKKMKNLNKVLDYDTIVYVGSLMAGKINGFHMVDKNIYDIEDKHIVAVAVGLTPQMEEVREQIAKGNCPFDFEDKIHFFQLRGGMAMEKLGFGNKLLLKSIIKRLEQQAIRNEAEEEMYQAILHGADYVSEDQIIPVVNEILHPTKINIKKEEIKIEKEEKEEEVEPGVLL